MKYILFLSLIYGCSNFTSDSFHSISLPKLRATDQLFEWVYQFEDRVKKIRLEGKYPTNGYFECRETIEVPNTYFCLFQNQGEMNYALGRATCNIEGAFCDSPKGTLISTSDKKFSKLLRSIQGHDLKGYKILKFYKELENHCSKNQGLCPTPHEKEFIGQYINKLSKEKENLILIAAARYGRGALIETFSHEVLHAQYFNSEIYRSEVDKFWQKMTEAEREEIKNRLSIAYDKSDEFLMKNEFQAYILSANAKTGLLSKYVKKYRSQLMESLEKVRVEPIQVKAVAPKN